MQALVINMKESQDRWDFMVKQLQELGISHSRLEAYDLSTLSVEEFERYSQSWERPLRKAEVGCFLSHKTAWQRVIKENKPYLVFEDDVILSKDTGAILSHFDQTNDYGLINFETTHRLKLIGNSKVRINHKYSLRRLLHNKTGAAAYIIWPSFAKKLLAKYSDQKAALADAALYTNFFKAKQFQIIPALAVQFQYSEIFSIESPFKNSSSISTSPRPRNSSLIFKYRRYQIQLSIVIVQIINLFSAKYKIVKFGKNN
jgi:glycosyl transferase family 25